MTQGLVSRATAYATAEGLGPLLLRSVTGTGIVRLAAMVASFIVGVELARVLGVTGYGYYGMALAVISIAGVAGEMGVPRLVTREVAAATTNGNLPVVFGVLRWADSLCLGVSAVMMVGIVVASVVLAREQRSALSEALLLGAPMIPLLALARIRGGALQGLHFIVRGQVPDTLIRPLLLSILIFVLWLSRLPFSAGTAMALNSITAAGVFLIARTWLKRRLPSPPSEFARAGRKWLASSIPMGLTDGMRVLQSELSVLILGIIAAPADVGLFRIANVTSFAAATPVAMINFVAFPIIARLYAEDDFHRLQIALTRLAQAQFAGVLILCLPLLIVPGFLLGLVFGPDYADAANTLRILAAAQIVTAAFGLNAALLNMTQHERRVTRAMLIALAVNLVALAILTAVWGRIGAAIALASALVLWNIQTWLDGRRLLGLETSIIPITAGLGRSDRS